MIAEIEETTWGVGLREVNGVRYVTLPRGTPVLTAFTWTGGPTSSCGESEGAI